MAATARANAAAEDLLAEERAEATLATERAALRAEKKRKKRRGRSGKVEAAPEDGDGIAKEVLPSVTEAEVCALAEEVATVLAKAEAATPGTKDTATQTEDSVRAECAICWDNLTEARHALVPCGHTSFCEACIADLTAVTSGGALPECPLCRVPVARSVRLFL